MSSNTNSNYQLSSHQRYLIELQLFEKMTPEKIIDSWNVEFHGLAAPSMQTIYKIKKQVDNGNSVEPKKKDQNVDRF